MECMGAEDIKILICTSPKFGLLHPALAYMLRGNILHPLRTKRHSMMALLGPTPGLATTGDEASSR